MRTFSPEWNILLASARACDSSHKATLDPAAVQSVNWAALLKIAGRHGMLPMLYGFLQKCEAPAVPNEVLLRLQFQSRANAVRNQQLLEELGALLTLFQAQDIPAIPYKGPALAAAVYGDLALRACGDLDILLRPADVLRAKELLTTAGYQPVQQFRDTREEEQHLASDCEYNFCRAADGILVELHWRFRPQFFPLPLDMDRLWARAQPVNLGGADTLAFAPEDLLLILCVHGAKHCWERLCWVCDIAAVLHAYPALDWNRAWTQASALGCGRVLLLGACLARELLGASLPDAAPAKMPRVVTALAAQVRRQLVQEDGAESGTRARMLFHLRVRDRFQDRVPYVQHHMRRQIEEWKA